MHPEDEDSLLRELLTDLSVLLIDGPRWKGAKPETTRDLSSIGSYCIVWSPHDLSELSADFIPTCNDWYCRSEHSTIQFLRSALSGAVLTEGRLAVSTDTGQPRAASSVERRYRMLRGSIKKTYVNEVVEWRNTKLPIAPAGPSRSANPSKPDSSLWVGPAAMVWLRGDQTCRIKQTVNSPVEGALPPPPNRALEQKVAIPRSARSGARS
jgi:hypothetical protein